MGIQEVGDLLLVHALLDALPDHLLLHLDEEAILLYLVGLGCQFPVLLGLHWRVWLDLLLVEVVHHLLWQLFQHFLSQFVWVVFELVEWNELHNVSRLVLLCFLREEGLFVSIECFHDAEVCVTNSNNNDTQRIL